MQEIRPDHPLRRLFAGLVEDAFYSQVGMCDPTLTEYLSDLLVTFTHVDRLNVLRDSLGKQLEQVAAKVSVSLGRQPRSSAERELNLYRHIGDYTLFWAGVYPEQLRRVGADSTDTLLTYVSQGKRSYAIVSELGKENDAPPASLFRHLSTEFENCIYGLGLVRRGLEHVGTSGTACGELIY